MKKVRCLGEDTNLIVMCLRESVLAQMLEEADVLQNRALTIMLERYGKNIAERKTAIRNHILRCEYCQADYLQCLWEKADKMLDIGLDAANDIGYEGLARGYDILRLIPALQKMKDPGKRHS